MSGRSAKHRKNRYKTNTALTKRWSMPRLAVALKLGGLIVVLLAVSALFMAGYAAVTQSDYFRIEAIEVHGNQRLSAAAVIKQAILMPGENVLAVNLPLTRKRLLAHPWIASASVEREIPGTLHLNIEEHQPLAVVDLGRKFLINDRGRIFKELTDDDPGQLPVITGIAYPDISLGEDALGPAMQAVLVVLKTSRRQKDPSEYGNLAGIHYDAELGLSLTTREDQRTINLGKDRFKEKYTCLGKLLPYLNGDKQWREFKTIDLSNPDRIVVGFGHNPDAQKRS